MSRANQNNKQPDFFDQGKQLINNIKQKVQGTFDTRTREGFGGPSLTDTSTSPITSAPSGTMNMGMSMVPMNTVNVAKSERDVLNEKRNTFDTYTNNLSNAKKTLFAKINKYAENIRASDINYNFFTNSLLNPNDISLNSNEQCIDGTLLTQSDSVYTIDPNFNIAYSGMLGAGAGAGSGDAGVNFSSFKEAKKACKTWAYDSSKNSFAVAKRPGGGYDCYTSSGTPPTYPNYLTESVAYSIAKGADNGDAKFGGLFANGQIGLYNGNSGDPNSIFDNGFNSYGGHAACDVWNGGKITPSTITASYGRNCHNVGDISPKKVRWLLIKATGAATVIQIARIAVYAFVNGKLVNVVNIDTNKQMGIWASPHYGRMANQYWPVVGNLEARAYPYIYHSRGSVNDYWVLDLGKEYDVSQIDYFNRKDCCNDRSNGMQLIVYNSGWGEAVGYKLNADMHQIIKVDKTLQPSPLKTQYVRVKANGRNDGYLQISQIAVYAMVNGKQVNVARKASTNNANYNITASPVYNGFNMLGPVDGGTYAKNDRSAMYHSETASADNFWELNLGQEYDVDWVTYYNRGDCCQSRADGMTITLANASKNIVKAYTLSSARNQDFFPDT
jgi:hypothetical protein